MLSAQGVKEVEIISMTGLLKNGFDINQNSSQSTEEAWGVKQKKSPWGSRMSNNFLLFYTYPNRSPTCMLTKFLASLSSSLMLSNLRSITRERWLAPGSVTTPFSTSSWVKETMYFCLASSFWPAFSAADRKWLLILFSTLHQSSKAFDLSSLSAEWMGNCLEIGCNK